MTQQWRVRYTMGGVVHYTEWSETFHQVALLYEQYQRGCYASLVVLESREVVRESG